MKRLFLMLVFAFACSALFVGCESTDGGNGGDNTSGDNTSGDNTAGDGTGGAPDMAQMMLDSAKGSECQNWVQLPKGATTGLWWEYSMSGMKMKWAIVAEKENGNFVVENPMDYGGTMLIQAFEIDPSVMMDFTALEDGDDIPHNVVAAWVGLPGKAPEERGVMAATKYTKPDGTGGTGDAPEITEGEETLTVGGWDIPCKWMAVSGSKSWTATDGPFEGMTIKSEYNDAVTQEMTGCGDDAAPELSW